LQKINLIQGSELWKAHRATMFNASDAPAMMNKSPYKTRDQLIKERATGEVYDVDNATQARFNDGHRFESLARPMAEDIIGEELSPVTGVSGQYSASFDGITFDEAVIFEHKTASNRIGDALSADELPIDLRIQMEHQLLVSGAEKCLFMATAWDKSDELLGETHHWYFPNLELRSKIVDGWKQFEKDVATYQHVEVIDAPEADAIQSLPAVTIQVSGEMTLCNLDVVTPKFDAFLAKAESSKEGVSIQNGDAIAKFSRAAAVDCKLTAKSVVSQMATVSEAVSLLELYAKKFDTMGLAYEKEVDRLKEIEKVAALNAAKSAYAEHVAGLQTEIKGVTLVLPPVDFQLAIKGLKTVESKNNALNTALANGKIAADAIAADIRKKLAWCKENAAGQSALFPDLQTIIYKPYDDFTLLITSRIEKQKADEAARVEAQRVAMQAAADAKAKAEADAILAAERKKAEAEQAAIIAEGVKTQLEAQAAQRAIVGEVEVVERTAVGKVFHAALERKAENDAKETNPSPAPRTGAAKEEVAQEKIEAREMLRTFYERFARISEFSIIIDAIDEYQRSL